MLHMEKTSALATLTAQNNVGSGKNDSDYNSETGPSAQAQNEPRSAAVAAAIERNHKRLLAIKRGSIASLAGMAGASLTPTFKTDRTLRDPANTFPDRPSS